MKAFVLDSNSWHFWLANYGEIRIWDDCETDICEYTRAVIKGLFNLSLVALGIIIGVLWVGASFYNVYDMIANGAKLEPWTGILLSMSGGLFVAMCYLAYREWREERKRNMPEPEPGFIELAYRKVKDKTCARIEFKTKE